MNITINILTAILGIIWIAMLIVSTITVLPAILMLIIVRAVNYTWRDALHDMYITIPADLITGRFNI